jgi:hypothetical protein
MFIPITTIITCNILIYKARKERTALFADDLVRKKIQQNNKIGINDLKNYLDESTEICLKDLNHLVLVI